MAVGEGLMLQRTGLNEGLKARNGTKRCFWCSKRVDRPELLEIEGEKERE